MNREHAAATNETEEEKGFVDQHGDGQMGVEEQQRKPPFFKRIQAKLELDLPTFLLMLKGGLSPAIALAAYQSDRWAKEYSTIGYLIAIVSFLALPILPRAKFFQSLVIALVSACLAAALSLLSIQCAVAARQASNPAPRPTTTGSSGSTQSLHYSTAASVSAGVWLFFFLYLANTIRAARPQLFIVSIQFLIFTIVASTYAPTFPNMQAGKDFVDRLLKVFLIGYAIATGVSLFILPMSSRVISKKQMGGVLNLMKACLGIHNAYMHGITTFQTSGVSQLDDNGKPVPLEQKPDAKASLKNAEEAATKLKLTIQKTSQVLGKLKLEIGYAKKEIGWGKLQPGDFTKIFSHLHQILLPISGLCTYLDILQSVRKLKAEGENLISDLNTIEAIRRLQADEWHEVVVMSCVPFHKVKTLLVDGLTHIAYVLELAPRPRVPKQDVEKRADTSPSPGDPAFAGLLQEEIRVFQEYRRETVQKWCEKKGIDVPAKFWEDPTTQYTFKDSDSLNETVRQKQNHQQLYLILYLEYLLISVCKSILDMVRFADSKVEDDTMSKNRLIFPGWRRFRKLIHNAFVRMDSDEGIQDGQATGIYVWLGDSLSTSKDPEHLPPANTWERVTNHFRLIPQFLGSNESAFGFRAAVASISLAIVGYIRQTHHFYLSQRGVWAVIMVGISMGAHTGAGVQGFLARIFGTAVATVASITVWYMGDQKPAAVIPLTYLIFVCSLYVVLKMPKHLIAAVISIVTTILIVGYELQDHKVGTKVLTSNGQQYYHVYVLAPYRLASVVAGIGVAFIWTYFPYPITTHATLRKDLGATLYLMANYYSCTHSTVELKLRHGDPGHVRDKTSPIHKLDKTRVRVFEKLVVMLNRLREHSAFTKYEPTFGGRFPKQTYDELIAHMQSLFNYMVLTAYSSSAFTPSPNEEESPWLKDFRRVTAKSRITSHELTSTLCLAGASITNAQPLPPYLHVPPPIDIADQLGAIDPGILSVKHIKEPCYAAFAVLEIASVLIMQEMVAVLAKVRELVGEVDFSVHFMEEGKGSGSTMSSLDSLNGGRRGNAMGGGVKGKNE